VTAKAGIGRTSDGSKCSPLSLQHPPQFQKQCIKLSNSFASPPERGEGRRHKNNRKRENKTAPSLFRSSVD
jgi:hypothetical protein